MAQSLTPSGHAGLHASHGATEHQRLWQEKLGVIAGFLVGLPLALAAVDTLMADSPEWVSVVAVIVTVAFTTRFGLMLATKLSRDSAAR